MNKDFTSVMLERTNAQLLKIVNEERDNYQPEAVLAAEAELAKRNLSDEEVVEAKVINEVKQKQEDNIANQPLGIIWKVLALIFPGAFMLVVSAFLEMKGYDKKRKDLITWTIYGVVFYLILITLRVILFF